MYVCVYIHLGVKGWVQNWLSHLQDAHPSLSGGWFVRVCECACEYARLFVDIWAIMVLMCVFTNVCMHVCIQIISVSFV